MTAAPARRRTSAATPTKAKGHRPTATTKVGASPSYKNWMVVGDTGVGKTVLAGTAPKAYFGLFEAQGTESAKLFGSDADELVIREKSEFTEMYEYFEYGTGCDDYQWLVMDSLDEFEECLWRTWLKQQKDAKSTRSLFKAELADYNIIGNMVKKHIDDLNRLPINVLYLVKPMPVITYDEDTEEEKTEILPMLGSQKNGNLARRICGKVSMVGYLESKQKTVDKELLEWRRLYTSRRGGIHAKNRYDWGPYIDDPTIPALVQLADKALSGPATPAATSNRRSTRRRRTA